MHLTKDELKEWVEDVKNYLATGGKVLVSYSVKPREDDERFFEDLGDGLVYEIFLSAGFRLVDAIDGDDGLNRGILWRSEVYVLSE